MASDRRSTARATGPHLGRRHSIPSILLTIRMADVARIISKDTSMAARLVRYANSPLYRGINNVTSVKTAITRIGIDAVKHAILSLAMRDVFTTAFKPIQSRMEALWEHSVAVAAKAALLAEQFAHLNREEAMLAGLIHDVGVIPILINHWKSTGKLSLATGRG